LTQQLIAAKIIPNTYREILLIFLARIESIFWWEIGIIRPKDMNNEGEM